METEQVIFAAGEAAVAAFPNMAAEGTAARVARLRALAEALEANRAELVRLARAESHLPRARLEGELTRTIGQYTMFAADLESGIWDAVESVEALPDRAPIPRPALLRRWIPVGPVAIFGASNFPFAFGSLGGDTASALAAGCPVLCKANPAHPELARRLQEIAGPLAGEGVFQTVFGGAEVGAALVQARAVTAVGFTGSLAAGRALMDLAAARPVPIPVYAEMGSVNPVFLLPGALTTDPTGLAAAYVGSLTLGVGQFCTNPGVVIGVQGPDWSAFSAEVLNLLRPMEGQPMLSEAIGARYLASVAEFRGEPLLRASSVGQPSLFAARLEMSSELLEECFGPSGVLLTAESAAELAMFAESLPGQLTATIHAAPEDRSLAEDLAQALQFRVGRLVWNGWPTGVEVCGPMHHSGPYPASSNVRETSVGNHAIRRWLRPLCEQNRPSFL